MERAECRKTRVRALPTGCLVTGSNKRAFQPRCFARTVRYVPKTNFKTRIKEAVRQLRGSKTLLEPTSNAIYTPMRINGVWKWMAFSEPDGLLVRRITVQKGDPPGHPRGGGRVPRARWSGRSSFPSTRG